jgi:hypothetical protein
MRKIDACAHAYLHDAPSRQRLSVEASDAYFRACYQATDIVNYCSCTTTANYNLSSVLAVHKDSAVSSLCMQHHDAPQHNAGDSSRRKLLSDAAQLISYASLAVLGSAVIHRPAALAEENARRYVVIAAEPQSVRPDEVYLVSGTIECQEQAFRPSVLCDSVSSDSRSGTMQCGKLVQLCLMLGTKMLCTRTFAHTCARTYTLAESPSSGFTKYNTGPPPLLLSADTAKLADEWEGFLPERKVTRGGSNIVIVQEFGDKKKNGLAVYEVRTHAHTHTHTHARALSLIHPHTDAITYTKTRVHARTNTDTHKDTHTYTYAHDRVGLDARAFA